MCGITGWVDFDTDVPGQRSILESMTDSLTHRGPDARGIWFDGHAALGHRRLSIIDLEHGTQPMAITGQSEQPLVLSFCGEIYNFKDLRSELMQLGHTFRTRSDTEVLLRGYAQWHDDVASHLNGMYAAAIWDAALKKLVLIRDRLGVKPLYYCAVGRCLVFASEPKALFRHPFVQPQISVAGFRELLDMVKTPELTIYDNIWEVRPGGVVHFDAQGLKKTTYWKLQATRHLDDLPTTVETVRALLTDAVGRQIVSDVPICTLLSGGLDSSAVTAIAAQRLGDEVLSSFSVDFRHNVDTFTADGVRSTPDAPFARALAEHAGTHHIELLLSSDQMLDGDVRRAVLQAVDAPPAYWGDMWPSLYLLFRALSEHSRVALSGEAADEIFGGYQWFRNPAAISANTFPWLTAGSSRYFGGTQLLAPEFLAALERDKYRATRYEEALCEVPALEGESQIESRMREISYLAITRFLPTLLDRNDRMSMAVGLEVRVPFCDHRLVEYAFNVPWQMKSFDGREKSLLREAVRPLLPDSVASRLKTPYPATQDGAYEHGLRSELADVLADPSARVRDLLDTSKVKALLQRSSSAVSQPYNRGSLEMVLWINRWLQKYQVTVAL